MYAYTVRRKRSALRRLTNKLVTLLFGLFYTALLVGAVFLVLRKP
ncbi:MAG: hypothetical protein ACREON_14260 [Gemmatimonadaceae bacterium]